MTRSRSALVAAGTALVVLAGAGCGGTGPSQSAPAKSKVAAKVQVQIAAPVADATVRTARVVVRGTVTPPDAAVQITGLMAAVQNGVFHRSIPVTMGSNNIDVVATKSGLAPVTQSVSIKRGQSEAQAAKARAAARRRAAVSAAAQAARAKAEAQRAARAAALVSVPDQSGERLDVAEQTLLSHGLRYKEVGGGTFGIVVKSNWTVCEMRPAAGSQVHKHTRVALIVDREC